MAEKVTMQNLLDAGVHYGHQTRRWNPKMKPYIFGARNGVYIFDLAVTMRQLQSACEFLYDIVERGGDILFVGTKRQAQECVRACAETTGMHFMCARWLGGTLTNNQTIRRSIDRMLGIQKMEVEGAINEMPKKEAASMRRELYKLERNLNGIVNMRGMPKVMVVVDVVREEIAVREASRLNIPIIGIVDSNCDPDNIDLVIPGNDDALRAIKIIIDTLASSVTAARELYERLAAEEKARKEQEKAEAQKKKQAAADSGKATDSADSAEASVPDAGDDTADEQTKDAAAGAESTKAELEKS